MNNNSSLPHISKDSKKGILYIVGTPIGNLDDISQRAIDILKNVSLVACEDTRQTKKIMNKFIISNKLISFNKHNSFNKIPKISDKLIFIKDITEQYKLEMMRRDFVGNVSHELRTPLTVLKGYVENLQSLDSDLVSKIQRPLVQMDMQVVRMEVLLKDLLWLSRIETIEGADKTLPINMTDLVAEIIEDLRAAYPERKIDTHLEHDDVILGDATELHSAVSNLVVNALKYSGHDDLVTVEWKLDSGLPTLTVRDEGEGIKPQHIPRLTERFYRVDKSRSQATGGTGLGLAIVKHVAVSHNAELLIDSVYGQGSVFSMVFKPHQKGIQAALQ